MGIPLEKWVVMGVLTAISIFLGMLPYLIIRHSKSVLQADSAKYKVMLTILSCFGGGVLFATSMLHLLPEVRESFQGIPAVWDVFDHHFPIAEIVIILGFLLISLVEEIAHFIMVDGHHGHHHNINTVVRHNSIAHSIPIPNAKESFSFGTPRGSIATLQSQQFQSQQRPSICITIPEESTVDTGAESTGGYNNNAMANTTNHLPVQLPPSFLSAIGSVQGERKNSQYSLRNTRVSESLDTMEEECPDDKTNFASSLRTFLALLALSFHAIMEGVTIGLQNSTNVWLMFGAVASHKFVISFCMGMELLSSQSKTLTYVSSIVFFSVVSPIGIIIGSLLASESTEKSLPVTLIEGLACGTILYVVFFEILNRERERKSYSMSDSKAVGFIQFFAVAIGLVAMGCLVTLTHGSHDSESGSGEEDDHSHPH